MLLTVCMCTNLFRGTVLQQLLLGIQLAREEFQHPTIHTKIVQSVGGFFHQMKVCQTMGRKDSIQTMIGTSRSLDSFLYEAPQNFVVFQIFRTEFSRPIQWY